MDVSSSSEGDYCFGFMLGVDTVCVLEALGPRMQNLIFDVVKVLGFSIQRRGALLEIDSVRWVLFVGSGVTPQFLERFLQGLKWIDVVEALEVRVDVRNNFDVIGALGEFINSGNLVSLDLYAKEDIEYKVGLGLDSSFYRDSIPKLVRTVEVKVCDGLLERTIATLISVHGMDFSCVSFELVVKELSFLGKEFSCDEDAIDIVEVLVEHNLFVDFLEPQKLLKLVLLNALGIILIDICKGEFEKYTSPFCVLKKVLSKGNVSSVILGLIGEQVSVLGCDINQGIECGCNSPFGFAGCHMSMALVETGLLRRRSQAVGGLPLQKVVLLGISSGASTSVPFASTTKNVIWWIFIPLRKCNESNVSSQFVANESAAKAEAILGDIMATLVHLGIFFELYNVEVDSGVQDIRLVAAGRGISRAILSRCFFDKGLGLRQTKGYEVMNLYGSFSAGASGGDITIISDDNLFDGFENWIVVVPNEEGVCTTLDFWSVLQEGFIQVVNGAVASNACNLYDGSHGLFVIDHFMSIALGTFVTKFRCVCGINEAVSYKWGLLTNGDIGNECEVCTRVTTFVNILNVANVSSVSNNIVDEPTCYKDAHICWYTVLNRMFKLCGMIWLTTLHSGFNTEIEHEAHCGALLQADCKLVVGGIYSICSGWFYLF